MCNDEGNEYTFTEPILFKDFVKHWPLAQWDLDKWCSEFGDRDIPFRCMKNHVFSDEPCWERKCVEKRMTFRSFLLNEGTSDEWMYFDYKYLHQWFPEDSELCKNVSWKDFGLTSKGPSDTTLWVGTRGAHTPAHQDTYGVNIVAQLYGKKRWILFPPETEGLKPTRVPYEESSVYSELNFSCPLNLDVFKELSGGRVVELNSGDALFVPAGWWHYVQNMDSVNIAVNVWLPHENDSSMHVSEALVKIFVAQICKDLPQETANMIINPNEDDLSETPLAALLSQLETVTKSHLDKRRKMNRSKRQKTCERNSPTISPEVLNLKSLLDNTTSSVEIPGIMESNELIKILEENIKMYSSSKGEDDDAGSSTISRVRQIKAVIDSFAQSNVIELVKQNLLARLEDGKSSSK